MRILVLGGTGFVGPHVVTRLHDLGHEVIVAHRGHTEAPLPPDVRHVHHPSLGAAGDQFLAGCAGELRRLAPEVVLHQISGNGEDAAVVMRTFEGVARRVVVISSIDVYRAYGRLHRKEPGPPDSVPLAEEAPLREQFFLDRPQVEKIQTERVIMSDADLSGTVLRWPMVYGPRDYLHRLYGYLRQMDAGRPAILLEEGRAQWCASRGYSENVARAVVLAVLDEHAAGRIYNVGEPDALSEAEWVRQIAQAAGWHGNVVVVPKEHAPPHLRPTIDTAQHWVVDTTCIRQELGYTEPVSRQEALRRTVAWERANPPPAERVPSEEEMASRYAAEDATLSALPQPVGG